MNQKQRRKRNNLYYSKVLHQFLGYDKEVFVHTEHSQKFYHENKIYILWPGANKLQESKSGEWIYNADAYIIDKVLKDKSIPRLNSFQL